MSTHRCFAPPFPFYPISATGVGAQDADGSKTGYYVDRLRRVVRRPQAGGLASFDQSRCLFYAFLRQPLCELGLYSDDIHCMTNVIWVPVPWFVIKIYISHLCLRVVL